MIRWIAAALFVAIAVLGFVAWKRSAMPPTDPAQAAGESMPSTEAPAGPATGAEDPHATLEPGLHWTVPATWLAGGARPMRVATYSIGELDAAAECAVFYFGPEQGGSVDENIDRWAGQFEGSPNPKRSVRTVRGMSVTRVEIAGSYLSPGMDMQSEGKKPGWRLLAAIVSGPRGMVFFKLTGPAATLDANTAEFDALLASLTAQ